MIVSTKTGILVTGRLVKDAQLRNAGSRHVLKLSVLYAREPATQQSERGNAKYLDIDVWNDAEQLDDMLHKGDAVAVVGQEVKSREYNGRTYYSMDALELFPSAGVVYRWLSQVIDMIPAMDESTVLAPTNEPTPFDEPPAQPQQMTMDPLASVAQPTEDDMERRLAETDEEDLPF